MRGPSKAHPKYRKHKATGRAIVTIDGRDIYLGDYGTKASRIEYDRLIGEWLANGRTMPVRTRSLTVVELVAKYWKFAKGYYVKNGKPTDELPGLKIALQVLKQTYGNCSVEEVGPLALVAMQQKFIDRGNCRRYVNQNIGRIKRCFRWGVSHKMEHKERHRCIVVGPKAQAILAKYIFRDTDRRCFIRNNGKPFDATQYAQAIKRACVKGKIEHWAPNQIRHKTNGWVLVNFRSHR
jgi:hypothetical protein